MPHCRHTYRAASHPIHWNVQAYRPWTKNITFRFVLKLFKKFEPTGSLKGTQGRTNEKKKKYNKITKAILNALFSDYHYCTGTNMIRWWLNGNHLWPPSTNPIHPHFFSLIIKIIFIKPRNVNYILQKQNRKRSRWIFPLSAGLLVMLLSDCALWACLCVLFFEQKWRRRKTKLKQHFVVGGVILETTYDDDDDDDITVRTYNT